MICYVPCHQAQTVTKRLRHPQGIWCFPSVNMFLQRTIRCLNTRLLWSMVQQRHRHRFLLEYLRHLDILRCYHREETTSGVQSAHHRISDKPAGAKTYLSKLLQAVTVALYLLAMSTWLQAGKAYQLNLPGVPGTKFLSLQPGSASLQPATSQMQLLPRSMFSTIYCGE